MIKVFMSYKQNDPKYSVLIERIYENLRIEHFATFKDTANLQYGDTWVLEIDRAVRECHVGVVIWTPAARESLAVHGEAIKLSRARKYTGIILEFDCEPAQFAGIQACEMFDWTGNREDPRWRAFIDNLTSIGTKNRALSVDAETQRAVGVSPGEPRVVDIENPEPFTMGRNGGEPQEAPPVEIRLRSPFSIAVRPTTAEEWAFALAHGARGLSKRSSLDGRPDSPVVGVTWREAQSYISWLNYRIGGSHYRLPTEAEWEYAARLAREGKLPSSSEWLGAVWQWTADVWSDTHDGAAADGSARIVPASRFKTARGASWRSPEFERHTSMRTGFHEGTSADDIGLRLVKAEPADVAMYDAALNAPRG